MILFPRTHTGAFGQVLAFDREICSVTKSSAYDLGLQLMQERVEHSQNAEQGKEKLTCREERCGLNSIDTRAQADDFGVFRHTR